MYASSFGHFTDVMHWFIGYWTVWYEDMVSGLSHVECWVSLLTDWAEIDKLIAGFRIQWVSGFHYSLDPPLHAINSD